jgi:hypothetical protein
MGNLYKKNYKIWTGKTPIPADENGEVLTFPDMTASSGDFGAGQGIELTASGLPGSEILVISVTDAVLAGGGLASGDLVAGVGIDLTASGLPGSEVLVISNTGGVGAGDVTGPVSSTDRAIAIWDGTGGDTLQDTGVTISASNVVSLGGIVNTGGVVNNVTLFASSPANIAATDFFCVINAAGAATVNLPGSPVTGQTFVIKDGAGDAGTGAKTITPAAGTIDGGATIDLASDGAALNVIYDGTEWKVY